MSPYQIKQSQVITGWWDVKVKLDVKWAGEKLFWIKRRNIQYQMSLQLESKSKCLQLVSEVNVNIELLKDNLINVNLESTLK